MGRVGYQESGFSTAGALDKRALEIGNILVDNPTQEAGIEMTLMGATMEFQVDNVIAITGANFLPMVNQVPISMYTAIAIKRGDILAFGFAKSGCRSYLTFAGGLNVPNVLGSKSTNLKCSVGGFYGRALQAGDEILFSAPISILHGMTSRNFDCQKKREVALLANQDNKQEEHILRVILGPQENYFTDNGIQTFFNETYVVSNESDRMGCKLEGPQIEYNTTVDIISDGIPLGGIQISSNGKPIIMLADRQTTGGYAKIATIISIDIPLIAQRKSGDKIRFELITIKKAHRLYKKERKEIEKLKKRISNLKD
jgi:biotin-dependent carboxylase-like uncharacterized protein